MDEDDWKLALLATCFAAILIGVVLELFGG